MMQRHIPLSTPAIPNISAVESIALILSRVHSRSEVVEILANVLLHKYHRGGAYMVANLILDRTGQP